jgi:hypothetical protein
LLAGTGRENSNISLVVSPDGSRVALVSTRDDQRSADGALLNTLTIVTTANGDNVTIAHAEQIRLIDWTGTRLVFEQVTPTAPPATRFSVIAYDYASTTRLQLANASKIGMVLGAQKSLYYTVSVNDADPLARPGLYKVNYDGAGKATLLDKDVWSLYRTDYNTLTVQTSDGWYSVNMASSISAPASPPAAYVSRVYVDNAAGTQSLWTDIRAGQGTLVRYDRQPPKDAEALRQTGLVGPMRWLTDDIAVFRVVNGTDSADYAVSVLGGGQAHRVADVVNTYGFNAGL